MPDPKNIKIHHIIGAWRSGTTMLSSILDAHPNTISTHESTFVMGLYSRFSSIKNWTEKDVEAFYKQLWKDRNLNHVWKLDKQALREDLFRYYRENENVSFSELVKLVYLHYQSINEKAEIHTIIDKNPIYSLYLNQLMVLYPETKFIYLVRDYRDNVVSRMKYKFHDLQWASIYAQWWNIINESVLKKQAQFPDRFLTVRYEDLANEPEKYVQQICTFLDMPYQPQMLEFNKHFKQHTEAYIGNLQEGFDDHSAEFHNKRMSMGENLFKPINTSKVAAWKNELNDEQLRLIEYICGDLGEKFGYRKTTEAAGAKYFVKEKIARLYVYFTSNYHKYQISKQRN